MLRKNKDNKDSKDKKGIEYHPLIRCLVPIALTIAMVYLIFFMR